MSDQPPAVPVTVFQPVTGPESAPALPRGKRMLPPLSNRERYRRERRSKEARAQTGVSPQAGSGKATKPGRHLTDEEAGGMVATVARKAYLDAINSALSGSDRKNASISLAVCVDKHLAIKKHRAEGREREPQIAPEAALAAAAKLLGGPL